MAMSSEDVLLLSGHVRYKKMEGALYVFETRIAWQQAGKDVFAVSHNYADIKMQKISPEGKAKVQLQLVMHDGSSSTFHFNNADGEAEQKKERNTVKEYLQQLLPRFKLKVNKELEAKNRMLQEDPELFRLYKELVVSQVLTADEFWCNIANKSSSSTTKPIDQETGISGSFLADVKPQTEGVNTITYNLTTDIIESIFKTYPAVKKKHLENVPHNMTESEFWTRFFQSHYFHRDRLTTGTKDLFAECAKSDEKDMKAEVSKVIDDPLLDLTHLHEDNIEEESQPVNTGKSSSNMINQNMIRRFNYHSTMVLKATETANKRPTAVNSGGMSGIAELGVDESSNMSTSSLVSEVSQPPSKRSKLLEKLEYEDLEDGPTTFGAKLSLVKSDRYYHGPTQVQTSEYKSGEEILQSSQLLEHLISNWQPNLPQVLSAQTAAVVTGELTPGGSLMQGGTSEAALHQLVSESTQKDLKLMYSSLCELLRHFYACFPVNSKALEDKVVQMKSNLERFQMIKLRPFQESLAGQTYNLDLTNHLEVMLQAAYKKFGNWQSRKLGTAPKR